VKAAKLLVLAVVLALASTAFLAPATAPAKSVLCSEQPEEFEQAPEEWVLRCKKDTSLKKVKLVAKQQPLQKAVLETESGNVFSCEESEMEIEGETEGEIGQQQTKVKITKRSFGKCTTSLAPCTTVESIGVATPFEGKFEYAGLKEPNGLLEMTEPVIVVKLKCGFLGTITCEYGSSEGEKVNGEVENPTEEEGSQLQIKIKKPVKKVAGHTFCPETGTEQIQYQVQATERKRQGKQDDLGPGQVWLAKHQHVEGG
jgi:hypothetical protein